MAGKGKVNTRFVVLLGVGIAAVCGLLALAVVKLALKSGSDYARLGDAAMAEGDFQKAKTLYGAAVFRDKVRVEWLEKWINAIESWTPDTETAYRDAFFADYYPALSQSAAVQQTNIEAHERLLELMHSQMSHGYSRAAADQIAQATATAARFFDLDPNADPSWKRLLRYRGLAHELTLQADSTLSDEDVALIGEDLRAALAADPSDSEVAMALMRWTIASATRGAGNETAEKTLAASQEALKIADDFLAANPNDAGVMGMAMAVRLDMARAEAEKGKSGAERTVAIVEAIRAMAPELDALAEATTATDQGGVRLIALDRLQRLERAVDPESRLARSRRVVDAWLEADPDDGELLWISAALARNAGDLASASDHYAQIDTLKPLPVSVEGLRYFDLKRQAWASRAEVSLDEHERAKSEGATEEQLAPMIARARELRDNLASQVTDDDLQLAMLDGRIAEAEGDETEALRLYRRYNEQTQRRSPEGLWLEGRVAAGLGQLGTARTALTMLLDIDPSNIRAMLVLADIHGRLRATREAADLYRRVLVMSPGNSFAEDGLRRIEAIVNPESIDDPAVSALMTARRVRTGSAGQPPDPAGAARLLEESLESVGYDPRVAAELASLRVDQGDLAGARIITAEALRRHPENQQIAQLNEALAGDDATAVLISMIELSDRSEVEKLVAIAGVAVTRGRTDQLDSAMARLGVIAPEDPRYVDLAFVRALARDDIEEAQRLAATAERLDLDRVLGLSYHARLASHRGDNAEAVRLLQQAAARGTGDSAIHRFLAIELRQAGRLDEAVAAFEQSLDIRPDDVQTIYEYVATLARANRLSDALDVARREQNFGQGSPAFVELWLSLEAAAGGPEGRALAIDQREQQLRVNPSDRANRFSLARLYIDDKRWDAAKTLIDQLRAEDNTLDTVELQARWFAEQGRVGARDGLMLAQQAYYDYIAAQGDAVTSAPFLSMARFMIARGRQDLAVRVADEAIAREDPATMDGTKLKGDLLMSLGQPEGAAAAFRAVVDAQRDTEDQQYRQRLVEMYIRTSQWDQAQEQIEKLPEAVGGTLTNLLQRAEIAAGTGDRAAERRMLDDAVARYPTEPLVYIKRAQSMLDRPELLPDLLSDIEAALRLRPNDWRALRVRSSAYYASDRHAEAVDDLRAALRANPTLDDALFAVMNDLLNRDQPGEALDAAREVLDARSNDAPLMAQIGRLFEARDDWGRAAQMYKRAWDTRKSPVDGANFIDAALRLNPPDTAGANAVIIELAELVPEGIDQSPGLLAAQSLVLRARGREDFARQQMTKAFDLSVGDDARLQNWSQNAARFYLGMNPNDEIDYYRSLRVRYPDPAVRAWLDLFIAQRTLTLGLGEAEAIKAFEALAADDAAPVSVRRQAFRALGNQFYQQEQYDNAVSAWRRGLEISPDDWELNNNIAYTLSSKLGKHAEALELAEKAVAADPGRSEPYDTLGGIYIALGKLDEAERMIQLGEQRSRTYSSRVTMSITRAKLEAAKGEKTDALATLDRAESILMGIAGRDATLEQEIKITRERILSDG